MILRINKHTGERELVPSLLLSGPHAVNESELMKWLNLGWCETKHDWYRIPENIELRNAPLARNTEVQL